MGVSRSFTVSLIGLAPHLVEVEADIAQGLPGFVLTGCNDPTLREARERVRSAIGNSGAPWPAKRITVGLSPASVIKTGSSFDVAIAVAVLSAAESFPRERLDGVVLLGELGLDGVIRPVSGVLPSVLGAAKAGFRRFVVPAANADEARLVASDVVGVHRLTDVLQFLCDGVIPDESSGPSVPAQPGRSQLGVGLAGERELDLGDVIGQDHAAWALEVAAAGGHHMLMKGLPGVGKTMLAERLPGLLPDLTVDEAFEVTAIHSVAGILPPGGRLVARPPFCAPHHTSSTSALIGGGSRLALPGAASVAHRGVLFLDEAPEFGPRALDSLRQPLESGEVIVGRAGGVTRYPARFQLVLAANPCGCAVDSDTQPGSLAAACSCSVVAKQRYKARLSGPLLDRIDIRVELLQPDRGLLSSGARGTSSATVRDRVCQARERAATRLDGTGWTVNAEVPGSIVRRRWPVDADGATLLDAALARGRVSPRGVDRVLKLSWTIADLGGRDRPTLGDVETALDLRDTGNRRPFGLARMTVPA